MTTQKKTKEDRAHEVLMLLYADAPDIFNPLIPLPMKCGIREDMMARYRGRIGKSKIRTFLKLWTARKQYQRALATCHQRYDLDGEHHELTDDHRKYALQRLTHLEAAE